MIKKLILIFCGLLLTPVEREKGELETSPVSSPVSSPVFSSVLPFTFAFSEVEAQEINREASRDKKQKRKVDFSRKLPEEISSENFPDRIDGFDYPNANLLDLVKAMSELTGINFIVDPSIKGKKISIIASSPITVAEAYRAFLSALASGGYTLVKAGAFWKVIPVKNAHKDNTEVYSGDYFPNTDQLITRIIKLKHINAKEFANSIKWLLSQDQKISSQESSNTIILSDYGSVIERVMKIIEEMDVPGSQEIIKIFPIKYASAGEIAGILQDLLSVSSSSGRNRFIHRSGGNKKNIGKSFKDKSKSGNMKISTIIPDSRTNALVVSANNSGLSRIEELIGKLDVPVDASVTGGVYVYSVLYGTADELYQTLMGIKSSKPQSKGKSSSRSSSFPSSRRSGRGSFSGYGAQQSVLFENVKIMPDSNTNSLIISAKNKYDYEKVLSVLQKIDIPRDQVFIQAIIVEMNVGKGNDRRFNLAASLSNSLFNDIFSIEESDFLGSSVAGFLSQGFGLSTLQKSSFGPGLVLGVPFIKALEEIGVLDSITEGLLSRADYPGDEEGQKSYDKDVKTEKRKVLGQAGTAFIPLIRLLKRNSNANVLSTPQIIALDNAEAFIEVGENAPVSLTSTAAGVGVSQSGVDRADITLKLTITPRINPESGTVRLEIDQKFDDFSDQSPQASALASRAINIIKRNIKTEMILNDGETAVLGGLLTDKETVTEDKVPLLGDIPVLGWLFKGSNVERRKKNLLVFITPSIIRGEEHKQKTGEILAQKLKERIDFIKKYMKGRDPHGEILKQLTDKGQGLTDGTEEDSLSGGESFTEEEDSADLLGIPEASGQDQSFYPEEESPTIEAEIETGTEAETGIEADEEYFDESSPSQEGQEGLTDGNLIEENLTEETSPSTLDDDEGGAFPQEESSFPEASKNQGFDPTSADKTEEEGSLSSIEGDESSASSPPATAPLIFR